MNSNIDFNDTVISNIAANQDDAPVFPPIDKNILQLIIKEHTFKHCLYDSASLSCFMELAENDIIYMPKLPTTRNSTTTNNSDQKPPVLRGHIVMKIKKPTKLKQVSLNLNGHLSLKFDQNCINDLNDPDFTKSVITECDTVNHSWSFFKDKEYSIYKNADAYYPLSEIEKIKQALKATDSQVDIFDEYKHQHLIRQKATSFIDSNSNNQDVTRTNQNSLKNVISPSGSIFGAIKTFLSPNQPSNSSSLSPQPSNNSDQLSMNINDYHHGRARSSTIKSQESIKKITTILSNTSNVTDFQEVESDDLFPPGYYVYSFEYLIPLIFPETVRTNAASIIYKLNFFVERVGAFKSNIEASRELNLIRIPNIDSVEESEPIVVSKEWDNSFKYEILVSSKDVILNAFLPIKINLTPIDKCAVHRIRVFITETVELTAYANGAGKYDPITGKKKKKRLTSEQPTQKFLLCEYKAPPLKDLPPGETKSKAKNLGNLLCEEPDDPKHSYLIYKEFPLQVYVPEYINGTYKLSPNISTQNIKITHSLKLNLRLSKNFQHFEISIDTPIVVQNKLSTHNTTLLPSYQSHQFPLNDDRDTEQSIANSVQASSISNYRRSSSSTAPLDKMQNYYLKDPSNMISANVYQQPENLEDDIRLTSPQAVPMSNVQLPDFEEVLSLGSPECLQLPNIHTEAISPNMLSPISNIKQSGYNDISGLLLNDDVAMSTISNNLDSMIESEASPPSYDEFLKSQNLGPLSPKVNPQLFGNDDIDADVVHDTYVSKDLEEYDAMEDDSDSESDPGGGYLDNRENPFV
ncbi:uncharacterized protein HGUI_03613 [Hanseniaspora guilliermondii]|uniref:Arrestin C-terminal-like domain-containing protein n=1 Tax=Hanseniaspora guilliermondii TaxID=56406 RepID=A0A1L0B6F5_9ASCO|nr:uncharacterized protein HGUI_03613 [Hanseniaspora guilliermondii]